MLLDAQLQGVPGRREADGVVAHLLQLGHRVRVIRYHEVPLQDLLRLRKRSRVFAALIARSPRRILPRDPAHNDTREFEFPVLSRRFERIRETREGASKLAYPTPGDLEFYELDGGKQSLQVQG